MVSQLRSRIESVLLVLDAPVAADRLASALGATPAEVSDQLQDISRELDAVSYTHLTLPTNREV